MVCLVFWADGSGKEAERYGHESRNKTQGAVKVPGVRHIRQDHTSGLRTRTPHLADADKADVAGGLYSRHKLQMVPFSCISHGKCVTLQQNNIYNGKL